MPRITDDIRAKKQAQARELYVRSLSLTFIAESIDVKAATIKQWAKDLNWEDIKRANNITPSQIQNMILQCMEAIKEGKKPMVSPDQLSKLAAAYGKLDDKRQHLGYMIDSFSELRTYVLQKAQEATTSTEKQKLLGLCQTLSALTDEMLNTKYKALQ